MLIACKLQTTIINVGNWVRMQIVDVTTCCNVSMGCVLLAMLTLQFAAGKICAMWVDFATLTFALHLFRNDNSANYNICTSYI